MLVIFYVVVLGHIIGYIITEQGSEYSVLTLKTVQSYVGE